MHEPKSRAADQAAGLRRIFGVAPARLAPILIDPGCAAAQVASIVRLAQACANAGERTLVVDCARAQIAASLGLRARFDLVHAMRGECLLQQTRLDAGPNLGVLPAARAAAQACETKTEFLPLLTRLTQGECAADLVLMIMEPGQTALLRGASERGEVVVPMPRERAGWSGLLRALAAVSDGTDIAGFRLLFPAWDAGTAARLYAELVQAGRDRLGTELRFGGAVRVARDWLRVTRAMSDWDLLSLPRRQTVRTF